LQNKKSKKSKKVKVKMKIIKKLKLSKKLCSNNQMKLCGKEYCKICFVRSFAIFKGKTKNCKLIVNCWSEDNIKKPIQIRKGTSNKYKFKCCDCNHDLTLSLSAITCKGRWCKYCSNQKLCDNKNCKICFSNSFASHKKAKYWNYNKNYVKPCNIFKGTHKKYWFNCKECHSEFKGAIDKITNLNRWCPYCVNKTEKKLNDWLKINYSDEKIKYQVKYEWCKNIDTNNYFPFDFSIEKLKLIISLDGEQHFKQVSNWKSPEENFKRDKYKMEKALENEYTIIRIYQPDVWRDKNNWKERVKRVIIKYDRPQIICIGCDKLYKKYLDLNNY
jgi:very-short-patch-repair endonuclease